MILKVPVYWVWILGIFLVASSAVLFLANQREESRGPGRYGVGTCLRNSEMGLLLRIEGAEGNQYILRILSSQKYSEMDLYRPGRQYRQLIDQTDGGSQERPVPCPKENHRGDASSIN